MPLSYVQQLRCTAHAQPACDPLHLLLVHFFLKIILGMRGTKLPGHDEFVDLLKSQTNLSRDTEWRGRRRSQLLETVPDPYQDSLHDILVQTRDEQIEHDNSKGEEAHTRILASLVPDEILEFIDDLSIRPYESAFLFGDISGK